MTIRLGIDLMGGDFAPRETTLGAIEALHELPQNVRLVLIGNENEILPILKQANVSTESFDFVHCTDVIDMADNPTKAIQQKPQSSIAIGFQLLKEKKIDAFASAGNTGAMLVGAMFSVKAIPGILRPCISSLIPKEDGSWGLILDVGVNADCKPEMLQQFALLGTVYAQAILHIKNPRVALMSIGEEEEKGNALTKEAHQLLKESKDIHFIGNVEGRDLFNSRADVIVCDGFTGNVMLKEAESFYDLIKRFNIHNEYFDRFNYEDYGGTAILGVNSTVVIAHGISHATAIKNMIHITHECVEAKLCEKITGALSKETVA